MWFRLSRPEYEAGKGEANRRGLRALVDDGQPTGILAYDGPQPVGWCSVAPRTQYRRLRTSRVMKPAGPGPLWSIPCLFVAPDHRRKGFSVALICEAARWAVAQGAPAVEAFPIVPRKTSVPAVFASQGLLSAYLEAGFRVVKRPSETRAIVRWPS